MPSIQRILKVPRTIGFKIAAGYSFAFRMQLSWGLTIFAYLFLENTLARQDRQMIRDEVESLQGHYNSGGWKAFYQTVMDNDRFRKNNPFFTRVIQGPEKEEKIFFPQYWKEFDLAALKELPGQTTGKWINLPNQGQTYTLEIFTASQPNGSLFQVGISTEDRLADLQRYEQSFLVISIPLILLAVGGGAFLSRRTLMPLRNLILTVESIESGKMDARVPETLTGDELDELGKTFQPND